MNTWKLVYNKWAPEEQALREALCTLGNGYFATRGAAEESKAGGPNYPGTYLAGGYNRMESEVSGRIIENEDMVNWPNWLCLTFCHQDGEWFSLDHVKILDFHQELDLQTGILKRRIRFKDQKDRETTLTSRRLVHMEHSHYAALEWELKPENWSGKIKVHSALDGTVINDGVKRYRQLNQHHLEPLRTGREGEDGIILEVQARQSRIHMTQGARTRILQDTASATAERQTIEKDGYIAQEISFDCEKKQTIRIEKIVTLFTSKDDAISEPAIAARESLRRAGSFDELVTSHQRAWSRLWHRCDMGITGDEQAQLILRLHIFHLLQTTSMNTIDLDVGVPSRGLHGEAYRGHIFWDELYIFPFLNLRIPELTRTLLMYRYRRLQEARHNAQDAGFKGAMFPWQSGSSGREENQVLHLNPKSGEWDPDNTYLQRHVNAAIAYNVWQYYQATDDMEFLSFYGAEIILSIAQFWSSIAVYNPDRQRYEIHNVVGPDEYHTRYANSDGPGLNNNAYTNIMAVWVLKTALQLLQLLAEDRRQELLDDLQIEQEELIRWEGISRNMFIPFHGDGIISQFEGYETLPEFEWKKYQKKYGNIQRLDRILKADNDSPNNYKAGKQADVLMLFYLFTSEELKGLLERLEYEFNPGMIPRNLAYYEKRTSHGSTLSRLVYSWVLARSDRERSWKVFEEALLSDYRDIQGGTTPEGIHLGAMAGTVDIVQRCYTGLVIRDGMLWVNPLLPKELERIQQRIRYRSHWIIINTTRKEITILFEKGWSREVKIGINGKVHDFKQGDTQTFKL